MAEKKYKYKNISMKWLTEMQSYFDGDDYWLTLIETKTQKLKRVREIMINDCKGITPEGFPLHCGLGERALAGSLMSIFDIEFDNDEINFFIQRKLRNKKLERI
jgi:hypothetical protein